MLACREYSTQRTALCRQSALLWPCNSLINTLSESSHIHASPSQHIVGFCRMEGRLLITSLFQLYSSLLIAFCVSRPLIGPLGSGYTTPETSWGHRRERTTAVRTDKAAGTTSGCSSILLDDPVSLGDVTCRMFKPALRAVTLHTDTAHAYASDQKVNIPPDPQSVSCFRHLLSFRVAGSWLNILFALIMGHSFKQLDLSDTNLSDVPGRCRGFQTPRDDKRCCNASVNKPEPGSEAFSQYFSCKITHTRSFY